VLLLFSFLLLLLNLDFLFTVFLLVSDGTSFSLNSLVLAILDSLLSLVSFFALEMLFSLTLFSILFFFSVQSEQNHSASSATFLIKIQSG
jgi:hypothetical protein